MTKELPYSIDIDVWWKPGGAFVYNRLHLDADHPENLYNYVKREFNVEPELYGIEDPMEILIKERFADKSVSDLIKMILELEREIETFRKNGW